MQNYLAFSYLLLSALMLALNGATFAETTANAVATSSTDLITSQDKGSELQLEVRQMPLAQVLTELEKKTKVPIHYSVLPEGFMTATCVGASLKLVLECLLNRKADIIVRYGRGKGKLANKNQIAEAWILGAKLEASPNSGLCTASSQQGSISLNRNDQSEESESNNDSASEPTNQLLKIAQSKNPVERADAISSLLAIGDKNDPKIKAMLEEAIHDQDANVRAQAISTLTHLGNNKESAAEAIQEAMQDSSVDVRLMAVDSITDDVGLLQQAINDSDEIVRSVAAQKLEQLMQEQKANK